MIQYKLHFQRKKKQENLQIATVEQGNNTHVIKSSFMENNN